jgi:hypothetical protein
MSRIVAVSLLLLPLAACSRGPDADIPAIEHQIRTGIREQTGEKVTVKCPDTIAWHTGGEFHCFATNRAGNSVRVTVSMENDQGDASWVLG